MACSFPEIKLSFAFNFPLFHFTYLSKYFLKSARSPLLSHTKIKGKHKDLQTRAAGPNAIRGVISAERERREPGSELRQRSFKLRLFFWLVFRNQILVLKHQSGWTVLTSCVKMLPMLFVCRIHQCLFAAVQIPLVVHELCDHQWGWRPEGSKLKWIEICGRHLYWSKWEEAQKDPISSWAGSIKTVVKACCCTDTCTAEVHHSYSCMFIVSCKWAYSSFFLTLVTNEHCSC